MFQVEQVNCICVDWKDGSRTLYTQAVHNIRVVGAEIAYFLNELSVKAGAPVLGWWQRDTSIPQAVPSCSLGTPEQEQDWKTGCFQGLS